MHLTRRDLLRKSSTAALAAWGVASTATLAGVTDLLAPAAARATVPASFTRPLPFPPVIRDADVTLTAKVADVQILDGAPTQMWTYNGTFPGPTIRRPSGERTTVTLVNDLPGAREGVGGADSLTLHHHGSHAASEHDGGPLPELAVQQGDSRTYIYENVEDVDAEGNPLPERAAMQWYHDHTHHRTSYNSYKGLAGLFILDDEFEASLPLPAEEHEIPLFLSERRFTEDNQLEEGIYTGAIGSNIEVLGGLPLVNGAYRPFMEVEPRRYRLRIHQGAGFSLYNLKLGVVASDSVADVIAADPVVLQQISTESGLMPARVDRTEILMGPAERVEVIVDFAEHVGQTLTLATINPRDKSREIFGQERQPPAVVAGDNAASDVFMQFRVTATINEDVPDPGPTPDELRELPEWVADLSDQPDRVFVFGQGVDPDNPRALPHSINGRPFDADRVDATPELGSTESWMLLNAATQTHYIHLHDVDWYVISRNGTPPAPHEAALKETFKIDPGEYVIVGTKFTDHLGAYMIHCHMLDHEDSGMMTRWDVVEPGSGQPTTLTDDEARRTDLLLGAARERQGCRIPGDLVAELADSVVLAEGGSAYNCRI